MPHRVYLFSLRLGHALRESCWLEAYSWQRFYRDTLAGIVVGIIAIPLAMALAIASGVAPQYGLYTAIIAGFVIALTGGSRYSVSGPTAAFVVILYPVVLHFGFGGLLVAGLMAGALLVIMALLRLGRLIEYIPEAVTLGFTGGIAIVIATLQVKDLLGLPIAAMPETYIGKITALAEALPHACFPSVIVASTTLAVMLLWPKLKTPVPPHLPAVLAGTLLAMLLAHAGYVVDTIGSRFSFVQVDGSIGHGIPPYLPHFAWPWLQPGVNGAAMQWNWTTLYALIPSAFSIAMLGAIESLLCAVVLDGMTGKRHSANSELFGQGIGNLIVPFFGGITATAAIARSAANYKAGAQSPVAAMVHALVVLTGLVMLAPWLAWLPMASMAALLVIVAWNMSEAHKTAKLLKTAPIGDIAVLLTCLSLTVLLDMVIAITSGILLATLLFMREIAEMTRITDITQQSRWITEPLPAGWRAMRINGPLFFAAADRVFGELANTIDPGTGVILQLESVPVLDGGGLAALEKFIEKCRKQNSPVILSELQFQPLKTLRKANIEAVDGELMFAPTLDVAVNHARH
jgi:SulP family sulfate permease